MSEKVKQASPTMTKVGIQQKIIPSNPHLASDQPSEGGLTLGLGEGGDHVAGQLASKFAHHSGIGPSSESNDKVKN